MCPLLLSIPSYFATKADLNKLHTKTDIRRYEKDTLYMRTEEIILFSFPHDYQTA